MDDVTIFSCGRGVDHGPCIHCGARGSTRCAFALSGRKAGATCDRPLCARHAIDVGVPHCAPHARLVGARGVT